MKIFQRSFDPRSLSGIRQKLDIKLKLSVKRFGIGIAVAIYKISGIAHLKSVLTEQPLIYLHLPLVSDLPVGIEIHFARF